MSQQATQERAVAPQESWAQMAAAEFRSAPDYARLLVAAIGQASARTGVPGAVILAVLASQSGSLHYARDRYGRLSPSVRVVNPWEANRRGLGKTRRRPELDRIGVGALPRPLQGRLRLRLWDLEQNVLACALLLAGLEHGAPRELIGWPDAPLPAAEHLPAENRARIARERAEAYRAARLARLARFFACAQPQFTAAQCHQAAAQALAAAEQIANYDGPPAQTPAASPEEDGNG